MDIERGQLIEIVVSVAAVAGFVAVLVWIGLSYGRDALEGGGGLALVIAITGFILIMAIVGYVLATITHRD